MSIVTSQTLLEKVKDIDDADSWNRFFAFYAPAILCFCRSKGCSQTQSNDILQETMVMLLSVMSAFDYSPSKGKFRNFLFKIVEGRIKDMFKREKKYCIHNSEDISDWVERIENSNVDAPEKQWEQSWRLNVFQHALENVKAKIQPSTYEAFEMYVLNNNKAEDVAKRFNIEINALYRQKNRVLALLRKEVVKIKDEIGDI